MKPSEILSKTKDTLPRTVELRRTIHRRPELGIDNPITRGVILAELERIGVDSVTQNAACSGVVADIRGSKSSGEERCILLRADTDALPLTETNDSDYCSEIEGRMHACGHDAHVAMLLGAADVLAKERAGFGGTVRLMFQPGEEGFGGAKLMIDEGVVQSVDRAFAIHCEPTRPSHSVVYRAGTMFAAFDNFAVTFGGSGGHASTPHGAVDPIPAIGPFVDGLSHVVARETDPNDRAVLSVTKVEAGTTDNVIPASARLCGTIRTLSDAGRELARERLHRVAVGVGASRGLDVEVEIFAGYPCAVNDGHSIEELASVADDLGLKRLEMPSPFMGSEDFSYVLQQTPGSIVFLGCATENGGPLHSDAMKIDESAMATGTALHVAVALDFLS